MAKIATPAFACRQLLRDAGLRATGPRAQILEYLVTHSELTTHAELTEAFSHGQGPDRATIYRTLMVLVDAGILVRLQIGDGVWRYGVEDAATRHVGHAHFVCTTCSAVECLSPQAFALTSLDPDRTVEEVQIRGRCPRCAEATA